MRILFVHNNFPGQYRRIVERLRGDKNYNLLSASLAKNEQPAVISRVGYKPHRTASTQIHPALRYTEETVITGQAALKALLPVRQKGWKPDIILGHSGWGAPMFLKDLWPDTRYLAYFEWYYNATGGDVGFLEPSEGGLNEAMRVRMKNTTLLQDFAAMDWGQCPTEFQASQFPDFFRQRMTVLHDGVDTEFFSPAEGTELVVGDLTFRRGDPLVTYIARGMEPYRGFPQFIEAIARLQKTDSRFHTLIIGTDRVAYGPKRRDGRTYRQVALEENEIDLSRVHFVGRKPLEYLRDALRVSAAHVYLTVPFVLSWSMMEAMSAGALIVGSDTGPVREMIRDGENGLLVPFHEPARLAEALAVVLADPARHAPLRSAARRLILDRYELAATTERYLDLIRSVAEHGMPER
jgi:glycosyltransferase involved in cell wall biosynthesis